MYAVITTAQFKPEAQDQFVRVFDEIVPGLTRGRPGYVSTTLTLNREDHTGVVIGLWESRDAVDSLLDSEEYRQVMSQLGPYFAGPPHRTINEVPSVITPRTG